MDFDTVFQQPKSRRNVTQIILMYLSQIVSDDELDHLSQRSQDSSDDEDTEDDASINAYILHLTI
ncbi:hypothetical protein T10_9338 [Trichinella papuae]|uniref:PiggyBac transposable element-derived protein domain-containing protein n=1 Tax=Trichinella papuae TaxID=268474 RepID=A0A0V1N7J4_9BILA|nr:hypothetical protein T10_9338 [Trichinella papuae]